MDIFSTARDYRASSPETGEITPFSGPDFSPSPRGGDWKPTIATWERSTSSTLEVNDIKPKVESEKLDHEERPAPWSGAPPNTTAAASPAFPAAAAHDGGASRKRGHGDGTDDNPPSLPLPKRIHTHGLDPAAFQESLRLLSEALKQLRRTRESALALWVAAGNAEYRTVQSILELQAEIITAFGALNAEFAPAGGNHGLPRV
ncbi:MAG: hypothetical protein Q9210_003297 [Variospora velana]